MRIAVFYNLFFSGAKRTVFEHVKGLTDLGHRVDVYTTDENGDIFSPGKIADKEYIYSYKRFIVKFPLFKKITSDLSDFFLLKKLHQKIAKDIDERKYDIALIHTDQITQAPFILRFLRTKNVYFCLEPLKIGHEYSYKHDNKFGLFNKFYERMNTAVRTNIDIQNARCAYATLAISKFGRELMISCFGLYPMVSYLGVDAKVFVKIKTVKKNQILFVGQKINMNGYNYALEAVKAIPKNIRPELKIISIGKGKKFSDKEMVKFYNESLLTLSLSNFDTFGLVPLESMSCGTPVIAFNVAGYRETINDNKTGFLTDFDSEQIKEKILYLLKNPQIAEKMGEDGRRWIMNSWTWEYQIRNLEIILKNII